MSPSQSSSTVPLASQTSDPELSARFAPLAEGLAAAESQILQELEDAQGPAQSVGGYYRPDPDLAATAMRPSATFNALIDAF